MSNIEKILEEETEASEANRDAPIPEGASVTRPNRRRSTVYSIRLNPDEVSALQSLADAAGVPASTLARAWIVDRIREQQAGLTDAEAELRAAQRHLAHLQSHLRQQTAS
jgi:predicted transcriptional regulator